MNAEILRNELKQWEKDFALSNGGRKPGRTDIKANATISAKYKQYDQLRRPEKLLPVETPRKRSRREDVTPRKRNLGDRSANIQSAIPLKEQHAAERSQVDLSPARAEAPTPAFIRSKLGPTPQKDGQVLGIFDLLPSATPSRAAGTPLKASNTLVAGTPSKRHGPSSSDQTAPSRTPASSGKRFFLEAFAGTPLKRKREEHEEVTPSMTHKQYATPTFLRRSFPLAAIDEDHQTSVSQAQPFKKRGLVRSLSSIIQGLKKQEEERMDDEWDVMNQIEEEEEGLGEPPTIAAQQEIPKVLVQDSQAVDMPLGPDQGPPESGDDTASDGGNLGRDGQPRKPWKKKGLKRQTRRVIMRPVMHKAGKAEGKGNNSDSEPEVVDETQCIAPVPLEAYEKCDAVQSDADRDRSAAGSVPARRKPGKTKKSTSVDSGAGTGERGDTASKRAPKKISATAHANFRALKIKNKSSKASGRGGRFGRRR